MGTKGSSCFSSLQPQTSWFHLPPLTAPSILVQTPEYGRGAGLGHINYDPPLRDRAELEWSAIGVRHIPDAPGTWPDGAQRRWMRSVSNVETRQKERHGDSLFFWWVLMHVWQSPETPRQYWVKGEEALALRVPRPLPPARCLHLSREVSSVSSLGSAFDSIWNRLKRKVKGFCFFSLSFLCLLSKVNKQNLDQ